MSYCHLLGGCGSTADFHPIVQTLLEGRLAANSPSCIAPFEDLSETPSLTIQKEISVDGGSNWFDADTAPQCTDGRLSQRRGVPTEREQ